MLTRGTQHTVRRCCGLLSNEGFVVRHYAGTVLYHAEGFLQKNNNSLHEDLELVLQGAGDAFLREIVAEDAAAAPPPKKGGGKARFSSVSAHFVGQLKSLCETLHRCLTGGD